MFDTWKIVAGILVFVIFTTFPIWYNIASGKATYSPELLYPKNEKYCVAETRYMNVNHMDMLNTWREEVVREGKRDFVAFGGTDHEKVYNKSLTLTCLHCHTNKTTFCDKCHNYLDVDPTCWDCHVIPKEEQ